MDARKTGLVAWPFRRVLLYSALWAVLAGGMAAIARPWSLASASRPPERREAQLTHLPQRHTDVALVAAPGWIGVAALVALVPPALLASLWLRHRR